jgi:hypothetical protein
MIGWGFNGLVIPVVQNSFNLVVLPLFHILNSYFSDIQDLEPLYELWINKAEDHFV